MGFAETLILCTNELSLISEYHNTFRNNIEINAFCT